MNVDQKKQIKPKPLQKYFSSIHSFSTNHQTLPCELLWLQPQLHLTGQYPKQQTFAILQGGPLRSNNEKYITRARELEARGILEIHENLQKHEYYKILNDSKVLFNCALQDWVSNTVSEADALGCNVLYPAYRSFPETFANDPDRLYVPWSIDDAENKLTNLLRNPHHNMGLISDWTNGTIDRAGDLIEGNGEQWLRSGNRYRDNVAGAKYSVVKIEEPQRGLFE